MATRMQQRRGTAAEWAAANPVLADGEVGFERDTRVVKVGDGVTSWSQLQSGYIRKAGGDVITPSAAGVIPLTIQSIAGQTSNAFEVLASAGGVLSRITSDGRIGIGGTIGGMLDVVSNASTRIPLIVRGSAGQTQDSQQWQNSAGETMARVASNGVIYGTFGGQVVQGTPSNNALGVSQLSGVQLALGSAGEPARIPLVIRGTGTARTVTTKALSANVATLTTSVAHGFFVGRKVVVSGVDATFDGTYTITSVPTTTTFTYAKTAADVLSVASGGSANAYTQTGALASLQDHTGAGLAVVTAEGAIHSSSSNPGSSAFVGNASRLGTADGNTSQGDVILFPIQNGVGVTSNIRHLRTRIRRYGGAGTDWNNTAIDIYAQTDNTEQQRISFGGVNGVIEHVAGGGHFFHNSALRATFEGDSHTFGPNLGRNARLAVTTTAGTSALALNAASAQSGDLFEIFRSDGFPMFRVGPSGETGINMPATNVGWLSVTGRSTTDTISVVRGISGQTGNLSVWQRSDAFTLAYVDSHGRIYGNCQGGADKSFGTTAFECRDDSAGVNSAPGIAFHIPGVSAASLRMISNGTLAFYNNPGTSLTDARMQNVLGRWHGMDYNGDQNYISWMRVFPADANQISFQSDPAGDTGYRTLRAGSYATVSTAESKTDIKPLSVNSATAPRMQQRGAAKATTSGSLKERARLLSPVSYRQKHGEDFDPKIESDQVLHSFVAEEAAEIMPEIVSYDAKGTPIGIDIGATATVTLALVQDLLEEIASLKARLTTAGIA